MPPDNEKHFPTDRELIIRKEENGPIGEKPKELDPTVQAELVKKTEERIAHEGDTFSKKEVRKVEDGLKQYEIYLRLKSPSLAVKILDSVFNSVKNSDTISIEDKENILLQLSNKYIEHGENEKSREALLLASDVSKENPSNHPIAAMGRIDQKLYQYTGGKSVATLKNESIAKSNNEFDKRNEEDDNQLRQAA